MIGDTAIGWGEADDKVSISAIFTALDNGINFFDTADIYGLGHSEELLGKTIGARKDVIIASKAGNVARDHRFTTDYSEKYIINACEASLKRLRREVIDYYQLHSARIVHLEEGACIEAMQRLVQQGKIRYWGISLNTFEPEPEAEFFIQRKLGNGFQLVLNLLNQASLPLFRKTDVNKYGIIVRMPLQFGLLTGRFDNAVDFTFTDHRKNRLTRKIVDISARLLQPVWALCDKYHCTKVQLALSYLISYTAVSTVITGSRTPEHVVKNTSGLFQPEPEDVHLIENLGRTEFLGVMNLIRERG